MKIIARFFSIMILLSVMLAALLPGGTAFAAKDPGSVTVTIHNLTGQDATYTLVDPNGFPHIFQLPKGLTTITMDQGWYGYAAGLSCGNRSGKVQLNIGKQVYLSCGDGITLTNTSGRFNAPEPLYCYDIYDYYIGLDRNNPDLQKGTFCQKTPAMDGDWILYDMPNVRFDIDLPAVFDEDFSAKCLPDMGAAYYGLGYYLKNRGRCS